MGKTEDDITKLPKMTGELLIGLRTQEQLLVVFAPVAGVYGKVVETTDVLFRFRSPDGDSYGAIDRTNGDYLSFNIKTNTSYSMKCTLRKQLF